MNEDQKKFFDLIVAVMEPLFKTNPAKAQEFMNILTEANYRLLTQRTAE